MAEPAAPTAVPSGLGIQLQRLPGAPVVALRAWLPGGARSEQIGGQALITGRLLAEGSQRRSWRRLAREAEERGMVLESFGGHEAIGISIEALARDTERALDDLAELLLEPALPATRFRSLKRQASAELESQRDRPELRTGRAFLEALYAPHPRSRPLQGSRESLRRLTGDDCRDWYRRALSTGIQIAVAGRIDEQAVDQGLRARLACWATCDERPAITPAPPPPPGPSARRLHVALPPGEQAHLFCGHLSVPRAHPDRPALMLLGVVLGAGAGCRGRLVERIRERQGLAYEVDVATAAGAGIDAGRFTVYAGTTAKNLRRTERALRDELERLLERGIGRDELEEARGYLVASLPLRIETAGQIADRLIEAAFYGPGVRPETLAASWRSLSLEAVMAAAHRHLHPDKLAVVAGVPVSRRG